MNLPNKITFSRIILTIFILILLIFPFEEAGIKMPQLFINEMKKELAEYAKGEQS